MPAMAATHDLWVCADRNNLPYSNERGEGFENKMAEMVARDLGLSLHYVWWPASPTFAHKIFRRGACDVIMGVPSRGYDLAEPTHPYYRSSYVFVTRRDRNLRIASFDDPSLRALRIGLPVVDDASTPSAQELSRRGLITNVRGYNPFGNLSKANQPAEVVNAVARNEVDVAIAWGPVAGYAALKSAVALVLTPICTGADSDAAPQSFEISVGVRRGEEDLLRRLDTELIRRKKRIHRLLVSYGVPLLSLQSSPGLCK